MAKRTQHTRMNLRAAIHASVNETDKEDRRAYSACANSQPRSDAKRMAAKEQQAFLNMQAAIQMIKNQEPELERRISGISGAKRFLHSGTGMLDKLIKQLNDTLPPEQIDHFERQKETLKMIVGVKAQMPRDSDAEHGRWLSFHQLDVVATAIRECCLSCSITDPQQQKQCMFCKLLDVLPTDKPDENATGCGYFTIWGGFK